MFRLASILLIITLSGSIGYAGALDGPSESTLSAPSDTSNHRSFFKTAETVTFQILVGVMGGFAGATLIKINPVVGGVGWIAGSSFGVYSVGDGGTGRGNYPWTVGAGVIAVLPFVPGMANGGLGAAIAGGLAMITSLVAEIVVYHITENWNTSAGTATVAIQFQIKQVNTRTRATPVGSWGTQPSLVIQISF